MSVPDARPGRMNPWQIAKAAGIPAHVPRVIEGLTRLTGFHWRKGASYAYETGGFDQFRQNAAGDGYVLDVDDPPRGAEWILDTDRPAPSGEGFQVRRNPDAPVWGEPLWLPEDQANRAIRAFKEDANR